MQVVAGFMWILGGILGFRRLRRLGVGWVMGGMDFARWWVILLNLWFGL